ncbi:MAG: DUF3987 domain-containing protein [Bacteroidota bacterium]
MEKKKFNPLEWIESPTLEQMPAPLAPSMISNTFSEVEMVIRKIEDKQIDIASAYSDWRNIGFAFADEFCEEGRTLFHRISRFYADYSELECNQQYDKCLKAKGQGISLNTFFFHAKNAGIIINKSKKTYSQEIQPMPTFPDHIFSNLPEILKKVVSVATSNEERDLLLMGSLVSISSCLQTIFGIYDGRKVCTNLFLYVTGQASAGKGRMMHCKQIVLPVHKAMREQARLLKLQYEVDMADYNENKSKDEKIEKPAKPPEKMLVIPANNSTTGVFQLLADSDGKGLIFETEGDTLAQAFKSDYGNYSDGFRKAFHHETISYYRRTDREYVDIENPCISAVLSGTPRQVSSLIPSAENGLFSRFIFYFMNIRPVWKDVFADDTDQGLDEYFELVGNQFYELYQMLQSGTEIKFCLSSHQKELFNTFFSQTQDLYISIHGLDYIAAIRRLGLIAFRLCMILSALRILDTGDSSPILVCDDQDFETTLAMITVLVKHSSKVFSELPVEIKPAHRQNRKEKFLYALPLNFNRQKYIEVAKGYSIPDKTAEGYITDFIKNGLIHREHQDHYINLAIKETQDSQEVKDS